MTKNLETIIEETKRITRAISICEKLDEFKKTRSISLATEICDLMITDNTTNDKDI